MHEILSAALMTDSFLHDKLTSHYPIPVLRLLVHVVHKLLELVGIEDGVLRQELQMLVFHLLEIWKRTKNVDDIPQ